MIYIVIFGVFLLGLAVGSFLNVCIYRMPENKSLVKPGSFCPGCSTPIKWYDNIPLLSYIFLRGKCRSCKIKIPVRYPLVELLTALLIVWLTLTLLYNRTPIPLIGVYIYLTLGLIVISFIDLKLEIIPDEISLFGIPVAFVCSLIFPELHQGVYPFEGMFESAPKLVEAGLSSLAGIVVGGGSLWLVGIIGKLILRKDAMGFGDVKLMAMIGGFIGWINVLMAILIACGIGSVIGIIVIIKTKSRRMPFGPFLALGTFLMILYRTEIIIFITDTYPRFIRNLLD